VEVTCSGCGQRYRIDDEKIPSSGSAYLGCPKCKEKIRIDAPSRRQPSARKDTQGPSPHFEFFEAGAKTALIYCPEPQARDQLEKGLAAMQCEIRIVAGAEEVKSRFKYHLYDFIALYQKGPEQEAELRAILDYINELPMEVRRACFAIYVHLGGNSLDSFRAFSMGVDLSLSPMELGKLEEKLRLAMEAKQAGYRVFSDCKARMEETAL